MAEIINPKKSDSQTVDGSPAQICGYSDVLATTIFDDNFSAMNFAERFSAINPEVDSDQESRRFESCPSECACTHAHTHAHAHTL